MDDLKLEELTYFDFCTHHPSTGAATDADSGPTAEVFEDDTDTTVVALTVTKRTGKTGNYRVPVTAAAASGFEVGKTYNVVASATVNAITGKGRIGQFKVKTRGRDDLAYPATSGRSTDVDASGRVLLQPTQTGVTIPTVTTLTNAPSDPAGVTTLLSRLSALRAGYLDNLSAGAVALASAIAALNNLSAAQVNTEADTAIVDAALATAANLAVVAGYLDTEIAAIKAKTDNLPAAPAATGDIPTAAQNAAAMLDLSNGIETGLTPRQALRLLAAASAGKLTGAATTTIVIRNAVADGKDRITATVDSDGNRSAITYDLS